MNPILSLAILGAGAYVASVAPSGRKHPLEGKFKGHCFAHRGLFDNNLTWENSLPAFERAAAMSYGIELDLQMTSDGEIVVFHDDNLSRLCGSNLMVTDSTAEQLQACHLGSTEEVMPLLSQVLKLVDGRVPLILEIKSTDKVEATCLHVYDLLRTYSGPACIESMNPLVVAWFYKNAPQVMRGQLATRFQEKKLLQKASSSLLTNLTFNFLSRPHFIAYDHRYCDNRSFRLCRAMGAFTIGWTVRQNSYNRASRLFDAIIFEGFEPPAVFKRD